MGVLSCGTKIKSWLFTGCLALMALATVFLSVPGVVVIEARPVLFSCQVNYQPPQMPSYNTSQDINTEELVDLVMELNDGTRLGNVDWDDIVWANTDKVGLRIQPADLSNQAVNYGTANVTQIGGFDTDTGRLLWYPTENYEYPAVYCHLRFWGKVGENWYNTFLTSQSKTPHHLTFDEIGWSGNASLAGYTIPFYFGLKVSDYGDSYRIKSLVTAPLDLDDSALEYVFAINLNLSVAEKVEYVRVYWPDHYSDYPIEQVVNRTGDLAVLEKEIAFVLESGQAIDFFDFKDISIQVENGYWLIEQVVLPTGQTTWALRIGGMFGSLTQGETLEVDPGLGASKIDSSWERLEAVYKLLEQVRLEHNRQGAIALSDPENYIQTGSWYRYAHRPARRGSNYFRDAQLPLLREQNALRDKIRQDIFTDENWRGLSWDDRNAEFLRLFGDKQEIVKGITLSGKLEISSPLFDALKQVDLDTLSSPLPPRTEDFTSASWNNGVPQADPNSDMTVTAYKVAVDTMSRNAIAYFYSDKGAAHFGDFEHLVKVSMASWGAADSAACYWGLSNGYHTLQDQLDGNDGIACFLYRNGVSGHYLRDQVNDNQDTYVITTPIAHDCIIERSGTTATNKIYSGITLLGTLTITCSNRAYQHVHAVMSRDASGTSAITVDVENLNLQEVGEPNIYVTPTTYGYGAVDENETIATGLTYFTVVNDGTGADVDISINASDLLGGNQWTLSEGGTPGSMICALKVGIGASYNVTVNSTAQIFIWGLADSANQTFGLEFYAPTEFTDGTAKSGVVTLTASLQ